MRKCIFPVLLLTLALALNACNSSDPVKQVAAASAESQTDLFAGHEDDAARFAKTYPVSADNPFIIASYEELITHIQWGTGIIVFGFPDCPRCKNAFPVLEKAFKEMGMTEHAGFRGRILYYDIFEDREADNERYQTLVEYTKEFLPVDGNGNPRIYSPSVFFLASGKIVGNHLDTVAGLANPRDSLDDKQQAELLKIYQDLIEKVEDCGC